jgi:hypothetical protein
MINLRDYPKDNARAFLPLRYRCRHLSTVSGTAITIARFLLYLLYSSVLFIIAANDMPVL